MLVGYMRVSTAEQSLALQLDALLAAGVEPGRVYNDNCEVCGGAVETAASGRLSRGPSTTTGQR